MNLNAKAYELSRSIVAASDALGVKVHSVEGGGEVIDAGIEATGSLAAGVELARLCLSGCGEVVVEEETETPWRTARVHVKTFDPVHACLASQYAGWRLSVGKFFAMGSGPMRAAYAGEKLFEELGYSESPDVAVGVLEGDHIPNAEIFRYIAEKTGVSPSSIVLAIAPTNSLAGGVQIVARSVETALHKLHNLEFDLASIVRGVGDAPVPPVADDSLEALGRTNDSMLYGAQVTLYVSGDEAAIEHVGPRVPASSSSDHGTPFRKIFARYDHDFYKIDPHLFSPAQVTFIHTETHKRWTFGRVEPDILKASFLSSPTS